MLNALYLSTSHLNPAYSIHVTDFLGCTHTRRGEVNLLFEHGMAHVGVVYGQASRGKIQGHLEWLACDAAQRRGRSVPQ